MDSYLLTIHSTIKNVLTGRPEYIAFFENTFRELTISAPFEDLLRGKISQSFILTSFISTLERTSEFIQNSNADDYSLAIQVCNPILFASLKHQLEPQPRERPTKDKQERTVRNGLIPRPHNKVQLVKPDANQIYQQLDQYLIKNPAPYANCAHIQCTHAGCRFCLGMFEGIQLTECSGHAPCIPLGWFPHVGKPLWNSLRKKHQPHVAFSNPPRSVKDSEIPNRVHNIVQDVVPPAENRSWADQCEEELDYEPASPEVAKASSAPIAASKPVNPLAQYAVSDEDMDSLYKRSPKRTRTASPAVESSEYGY